MNVLPGYLFVVLLLGLTAGSKNEPVTGLDEIGTKLPCPGICQGHEACETALQETSCAEGLVCCLDHLDSVSTTEFADLNDATTESLLDSNTVEEVTEEEEDNGEDVENLEVTTALYEEQSAVEDVESEEDSSYQAVNDGNVVIDNTPYTIVYSESGDPTLVPVSQTEEEHSFEVSKCPGTCVSTTQENDCSYIMSSNNDCPPGSECCLSEEDFRDEQYVIDTEEVMGVDENQDMEDIMTVPEGLIMEDTEGDPEVDTEEHEIGKRSIGNLASQYNCPGTCVHPIHVSQCQHIFPQFPCPLNTKCCMLHTAQRSFNPKPARCTGMCIPLRMAGHCLPPNELVMGPTTCPSDQTCCTRNPSNTKPPHLSAMSYPRPQQSNTEQADVLGHIAVDDSGNVFTVSSRGQISPLRKLPLGANLKEFIKIGAYPRLNSELVIFSDELGSLYHEFFPRYTDVKPKAPLLRQPVKQFASQASEQSVKFQPANQKSEKDQMIESNMSSNSDIVIPDDDDEAPVTTNTPVIHTDKSSRPPCPGSCMSHFLRFTCFRGYAIYDGFSCPGRGVCCALMKDIEDHEEYLKSLSPYFNASPSSKDPSLPRCGVKGRRDTPRIMGGKDSLPGDWCWQVAVINLENQYLCGGALIDNSWVLTAGHCVSGPLEKGQAIFVRAGVTDLKSSEENGKGQTIRVLSTFMHHNYNSVNLDNNIALLRLQSPLELNTNVCVVCLPTSRQMPQENTKCTVTGYGFVSPEGGMSLRMKEAIVPIIDDMVCMANVTDALDNAFILPSSSFCAGGEGLTDACQGDAGGALVCKVGGFYELVGLVSWGLGCGRSDVPSIYIKIPTFMGWINQIISSNSFFSP